MTSCWRNPANPRKRSPRHTATAISGLWLVSGNCSGFCLCSFSASALYLEG